MDHFKLQRRPFQSQARGLKLWELTQLYLICPLLKYELSTLQKSLVLVSKLIDQNDIYVFKFRAKCWTLEVGFKPKVES